MPEEVAPAKAGVSLFIRRFSFLYLFADTLVNAKSGPGHLRRVASAIHALVAHPSAPCAAEGARRVRNRGSARAKIERPQAGVASVASRRGDGSAGGIQPRDASREPRLPGRQGKASPGVAQATDA